MITYSNGTNITDNNHQSHDEYSLGQFKDDQFQNHRHDVGIRFKLPGMSGDETCFDGLITTAAPNSIIELRENSPDYLSSTYRLRWHDPLYGDYNDNKARFGEVTRGKRKGVKYIIKVL